MKHVVLYNMDAYCRITLGEHALVVPINHESRLVTNGEVAYTSTVLRRDGNTFETHNTIYVGMNAEAAATLSSFIARPTKSPQR